MGLEFCSGVGKSLLDFFASNFAQKKACRALTVSSFELRKKERRYLTRQCYEAAKFMTHYA